jgi:hypothetical protein
LIQWLIENSNEHDETARNLSEPTLLAETDDGSDARRQHDPGSSALFTTEVRNVSIK